MAMDTMDAGVDAVEDVGVDLGVGVYMMADAHVDMVEVVEVGTVEVVGLDTVEDAVVGAGMGVGAVADKGGDTAEAEG